MSDGRGRHHAGFEPYINEDAPLAISTRDKLASLHLDEVEWALVELCVDAARAVEEDKIRRLTEGTGKGEKYEGPTAEGILNAAGVPARRQCVLLSAVITVGRERGVSFNVESGHNNRMRNAA